MQGVLFARRGDSDEEALLMWRPFQSPYTNSEWSLALQSPERVEAIVAGKSFLAVATSLSRLRLFTTAGRSQPLCKSKYTANCLTLSHVRPYLQITPSALHSGCVEHQHLLSWV